MSVFSLRKATWDDSRLLFEWANDEDTRRNSFNTDRISWDEHRNWLSRTMSDKSAEIFICCRKDRPVGQVRLNCEEYAGTISFSVAKEYRGEGIGNEIIGLIEEKAGVTRPYLKTLIGNVKPENISSRMIFEKNDYTEKFVAAGQPYIQYSKTICRTIKPIKIGIRTDANGRIASGHMMRCLAVAAAVKKCGLDCVFFASDNESARLPAERGFEYAILNSQWDNMDTETDVLMESLRKFNIGILLVDSYCAAPEYFQRLKGRFKTAYIDDLGTEVYPADIVINYNVYAEGIPYENMYAGSKTKLLLGAGYVPLREEFCSLDPAPVRKKVSDIMITTGSSDPYGVSGILLNRLLNDRFFNGKSIHLAAGRYYTNLAELEEISAAYPQLTVYKNVESVSKLMTACDIAVSAGGTTAYELCVCGTPSALFSFADNQTRIRLSLGKCGAAIDCGDFRGRNEECIEEIINALKSLDNRYKRIRLRKNALKITDGRGAEKIAEHLVVSAEEKALPE